MKEIRKGFIWLYAVLGAIELLTALILTLNNTARHWLLTHAPAGWYSALGAGVVMLVSLGTLAATQAKAHKLQTSLAELQGRYDYELASGIRAKETRRQREATLAADQLLVEELLDGWRPNDGLVYWLTADFFVGHAPIHLYDQVYNHAVAWQSETREFASEPLASAFAELHAAVDQFVDVGSKEWWLGTDAQQGDREPRWLYPRVRNNDEDLSEWKEVEGLLFGARDRLLTALNDLYRLAHAEGIVLAKADLARGTGA